MKIPKINIKGIARFWPFFLIFLTAVLAVWMAYEYLNSRSMELEERLSSQSAKAKIVVVVPMRDLRPGEELDLSTLATREVPRDYVNGDFLTQDTVGVYAGKKVLRAVTKGTPLLASFVAMNEFKPFSTTLEPGTRAITLPVDEINSVSGMLTAGDRVDLLLLTQNQAGRTGERSEMQLIPLLEGITVRATGTTTQREVLAQAAQGDARTPNRMAGSYNTITIAVQPRDAQKIVLAQQSGRIIALLRRQDDAGLYGDRVTSSEIFGYQTSVPPPSISYIVGGSFSTGGQGVRAYADQGAAGGPANSDLLKQVLQSFGTANRN